MADEFAIHVFDRDFDGALLIRAEGRVRTRQDPVAADLDRRTLRDFYHADVVRYRSHRHRHCWRSQDRDSQQGRCQRPPRAKSHSTSPVMKLVAYAPLVRTTFYIIKPSSMVRPMRTSL